MNIMLVMVIGTSVFYALSALEYVYRAWTYRSKPTPATWILMFVAFTESVFLYVQTANYSLAGNIGNVAGWLNVSFITAGVVGRHLVDGTLHLSFNDFQWKCMKGGGWIIGVLKCTPFLRH